MSLIRLSLYYILKNRVTSFFLFILFLLPVSFFSAGYLLHRQTENAIHKNNPGIDLIIAHTGRPDQLLNSILLQQPGQIMNLPGVNIREILRNRVIHTSVPVLQGGRLNGAVLVGTNLNYISLYDSEFKEGTWCRAKEEVVIGYKVAQMNKLKTGDKLARKPDDYLLYDSTPVGDYYISGILKKSHSVIDDIILMEWSHLAGRPAFSREGEVQNGVIPENQMAELFPYDLSGSADDRLTAVLIRFRSQAGEAALIRMLKDVKNIMVINPDKELHNMYQAGRSVQQLYIFLGLILTILMAGGICTLMQSWRMENREEECLIRSLGGTRFQAFLPVFLAVSILVDTASFTGILLGHVVMIYTANYLAQAGLQGYSALNFFWPEILLYLSCSLAGFLIAWIPYLFHLRSEKIIGFYLTPFSRLSEKPGK